MATPLPDPTGWHITPTLHQKASGPTDPRAATPFPPGFAVCVTGASRGIGLHIAQAYAVAGASTIITVGRNAAALEAAAETTRRVARRQDMRVVAVTCDITSDVAVAALAERVKAEVGRLDVVVVNAALWGATDTRVTEGSTAQFQACVDTYVMGAYLLAHYLLPVVLDSDGDGTKALIAIGGTGAWVTGGPVAHIAHCMCKLAQVRMMEMIANDFAAEKRLMCLTVHPGCVWTDTSQMAPEMFHQCRFCFPARSISYPDYSQGLIIADLTDDIGLCGGFLVWLTSGKKEDKLWLNGRFLSATWDVDELSAMKDAIVKSDMLKPRMVVS